MNKLFVLLLVACGGTPAKHDAPEPTAPADLGPSSATDLAGRERAGDLAPPALQLVHFESSPTELVQGQSARFTATAIGHVANAKLVDPSGQIGYGALVAVAPGTYTIDLSWTQINQALPINFVTEERRSFVAQLTDAGGATVSASVTLRLHCNGLGVCNGQCDDLQHDNDNCGACGNKVALPRQCINGTASCYNASYCPATNTCVDLMNDANNCGSCGHVVAPLLCANGQIGCSSGYSYCSQYNACIDLSSDPYNCGACGHNVSPASCVNGQASGGGGGGDPCTQLGGSDCGGFHCAYTNRDPYNCGSCGHLCDAGQSCIDGQCR